MHASDYVNVYLQLWCWVNDTFTVAAVRNYLQTGHGAQSSRAENAYSQIVTGVTRLTGLSRLPAVFEVQGDKYTANSLWRVYHGKGAPNEIQDALWLASLCGLVNEGSLSTYCDTNLGIDCGGFVANYWGMGRPDPSSPNPAGATGYKPRTIWGLYPELRRKDSTQIQIDDAAIFFQDVKSENPDLAASQNPDGSYNRSSGSQAFHIGLVSSVSVIPGTGQVYLEIAESSGASASSGGNGVNVRSLGQVTATVSNGLVYCPDGANRIYFTGRRDTTPAYQPNSFGA